MRMMSFSDLIEIKLGSIFRLIVIRVKQKHSFGSDGGDDIIYYRSKFKFV